MTGPETLYYQTHVQIWVLRQNVWAAATALAYDRKPSPTNFAR